MKVLLIVVALVMVFVLFIEHLWWHVILVNYGFTNDFSRKLALCMTLTKLPLVHGMGSKLAGWLDKTGNFQEYYQYENYSKLDPFLNDINRLGWWKMAQIYFWNWDDKTIEETDKVYYKYFKRK